MKLVCIVAAVMTGLIAGLMLGSGMDQYASRQLSATGWTSEHQAMDGLFRHVMPALFNATVALLLLATWAARGSGRWLFATAALLMMATVVMTVKVEVPLNRQIAQWSAAAPPANWADMRDNWMSFHWMRTLAGVAAFLCAAVGLTRIRAVRRE